MKFLSLAFATVFIGFATYLYFHLGFKKEATILGEKEAEFFLIGTSHTGPYFKIHEKISEIEAWAKKQNLPCEKTFGYFLDDPKISDEDRLRSEGGCISSSFNYDETPLLPKHIFTKKLDKRKFLVLEFNGSPAISPFKVYPIADDWFAKNKIDRDLPVLEIYEVNNASILTQYYFQIKEPKPIIIPNIESSLANPEDSPKPPNDK